MTTVRRALEVVDACQALLDRGTKPTCPEVRPIIDAYYELPDNGAGGELHCVLDDHNREKQHIRYSLANAERIESQQLARVLLLMSNSQLRRV